MHTTAETLCSHCKPCVAILDILCPVPFHYPFHDSSMTHPDILHRPIKQKWQRCDDQLIRRRIKDASIFSPSNSCSKSHCGIHIFDRSCAAIEFCRPLNFKTAVFLQIQVVLRCSNCWYAAISESWRHWHSIQSPVGLLEASGLWLVLFNGPGLRVRGQEPGLNSAQAYNIIAKISNHSSWHKAGNF